MRNNEILMEIIARAFGARYPALVASQIAPDCRDVPAAIAALRERLPMFFDLDPR